MTITVTLYTRKDCAPCQQVKADLEAIQSEIPHTLVEIDVDTDVAVREKYAAEVPVVEVGPYKLKTVITKADLLMSLGAARDRISHLDQIGDPAHQRRVERGKVISSPDKLSMWLSNHWLAAVNLIICLYVGLPFLAPVLMKSGATFPAQVIYTAYSPLCHQLGFRSFFLFGEQPYYPRLAAGVPDVKTLAWRPALMKTTCWQPALLLAMTSLVTRSLFVNVTWQFILPSSHLACSTLLQAVVCNPCIGFSGC